MSAQTHVATAHAVEACGAKPVFVDCELKTGNIDIEKIEKKITKKTKCICITHFLGRPTDMRKVNRIARKHNLKVVEDHQHLVSHPLLKSGYQEEMINHFYYTK